MSKVEDKPIEIEMTFKNTYKFLSTSEFINNPITKHYLQNTEQYLPMVQRKLQLKNQQIKQITDHFYFSVAEFICENIVDQEEKKKLNHKHHQNQTCSICMCDLYDIDNMDVQQFQQLMQNDDDNEDVFILDKCEGHYFHVACFVNYLKSNNMKDYTTCPVCQRIYGIKKGNQPKGTMNVHKVNQSCQGYENYKTIVIDYNFPSGQYPDINNGVAYSGTRRRGYLPDNDEGRKVLKLLQTSFDRGLTFQVGTSVTTGQTNCVVWAGIHHKTSMNGGAFGYPDKTYLSRVQEELASKGVY